MGEIRFAWWNLQNFFDTDDDPISKDFEYTAEEGWTQEKYDAKTRNLAQALSATHGGDGPQLLAVCEIETDDVLRDLLDEMGADHMSVVSDPETRVREEPADEDDLLTTSDLRGIDVTMAYDERVLELVSSASHVVHLRYRTRDVFEAVFEVVETGERLVVIASHWPSRSLGKYRSEPLRAAVGERIAYLVEDHVKVRPTRYEELRERGDDDALAAVREKWDTNVLVVGDFNDEPGDRSVTEHLKASSERDRVVGETNDIDGFREETADYRGQDVFLYNPMWRFLHEENVGTYFIDRLRSGEKFANRYQVLDQLVASRGLLGGEGLRLNPESVEIVDDSQVATSSGRPRRFEKSSGSGVSDHLPVIARLEF
jgi:hypothetical protein